jgi:hypothetical protein
MKSAKTMVLVAFLCALGVALIGQAMAGGTEYRDLNTSEFLKRGGHYTESIDMLFDVKQGGELSLGTTNGSVQIKTWSRNQVRLVVTKTTNASSPYNARTILENFLVQARHQGKDLQLKALANTEACKQSVGVTFTVWVPQNYNVAIDTGDGNVDIGKLNGSFSAKTGNGKISFECEPEGMDIEVEDHTNGSKQDEDPVAEDTGEGEESEEGQATPKIGERQKKDPGKK